MQSTSQQSIKAETAFWWGKSDGCSPWAWTPWGIWPSDSYEFHIPVVSSRSSLLFSPRTPLSFLSSLCVFLYLCAQHRYHEFPASAGSLRSSPPINTNKEMIPRKGRCLQEDKGKGLFPKRDRKSPDNVIFLSPPRAQMFPDSLTESAVLCKINTPARKRRDQQFFK